LKLVKHLRDEIWVVYLLGQGAVQGIRSVMKRMFRKHVVVVELSGAIAADNDVSLGSDAARPEARAGEDAGPPIEALINVKRVEAQLTKAFQTRGINAIALVINSPGGSPAQSSLIYRRLRELKREHPRVKLLAFVEDYAASGGYYIASAADEIIADPSSIVGSVGVISSGFGYVGKMRKEGLERRLVTAGKSKGGVDPYTPLGKQKSVLASQRRLMKELHSNFISDVKQGRGDRLQPEAAARLHCATQGGCSWLFPPFSSWYLDKLVRDGAGLFDGSVYSGQVAKELGLVDEVGEMNTELKRRFGRRVYIERETRKLDISSFLSRLLR
jgi:signal peptide peptidase SppA